MRWYPPPFVGHYNTSSNSSWNVSIVDLEPHHNNEKVLCYTFCDEVLPLLQNLNFLRYIKWGKALYKMRKSEKTTFQWPKVIKLLITIPCHRPDFRTGLIFSFWAPEVTILRVRKGHFHCFSSLQKRLIVINLPRRCYWQISTLKAELVKNISSTFLQRVGWIFFPNTHSGPFAK